ncbi:flagellar basal-body rod protein FlgF [Candidatus Gastranaerophilus sp. (ex Termes propinquus)]|nr:flagellar basal-body rod protein FlgF [Candidatus Gastranaerophilus sp. (ex Termes propinquus)]
MITRGLEAASRGMQSLIQYEDVIANNLANVNTTGFKRTSAAFKNVLDTQVTQKMSEPEKPGKIAGSVSLGNVLDRTYIDFNQGALNHTGSKLDVGIQGEGFFKMRLKDSLNEPDNREENYYYSRAGNFKLTIDSYLINNQGDYVMDEQNRRIRLARNPEDPEIDVNNRIQLEKELLISEDGLIQLVNQNDTVTMQKIQIVDFQNKSLISSLGEGKFLPIKDTDPGRYVKNGGFSLQQGMLEAANVSTVSEMIQSINVSRTYETLTKIVKTNGDTVSQAIELGKIKG